MEKRGKFIVFDGPDGCGKGTQVMRLASYIFNKDKSNSIFVTREPYRSRYYQEIRRMLRESADPKENAETFARLFVEDRKVHAGLIERHLRDGDFVISDRYKYSTLAYQQTQGIQLTKLIEMHEGILVPDLVFLIDVPAEIAVERLAKDTGREYKEVFEKLEFQKKLRKNFLALPKQLPNDRIVVIDGTGSVPEVFDAIRSEMDRILTA